MNLSFLIIGAQKAATTFVQRSLVDHPEVAIPDTELDFLIHNREPAVVDSILSTLFAGMPPRKISGLKGADYLGHPEIAKDLSQLFPGVRLIVILRDPVDRAFSAYHHLIRYGFIPAVAPETGLRNVFLGDWDDTYPLAKQIRDYGLYGQHLQQWLTHFDRNDLLVLAQENIHKNPPMAASEVYQFLGVNPDFQSRNLKRRSQAVTYDLRRLRWLSLGGKFRQLLEHRQDNGVLDAGKWQPLADLVWYGITAVDRLALAPILGNKKAPISTSLRAEIKAFYAKDQALLKQLCQK